MRYKDILDAAFVEKEKEMKDVSAPDEDAEKQTVTERKTGNIDMDVQSEKIETQALTGKQTEPQSADMRIETARNHNEPFDMPENAEETSAQNQNKTPNTLEEAAQLIRRINGLALSAAHDLDITRAKELEGLSEILAGLFETARETPPGKEGAA
ncbi:MAG: hypothetical protein FWE84_04680 [Firmicutes bacterium]|nr:hypothetical protein [Bacillota bacterium]